LRRFGRLSEENVEDRGRVSGRSLRSGRWKDKRKSVERKERRIGEREKDSILQACSAQ